MFSNVNPGIEKFTFSCYNIDVKWACSSAGYLPAGRQGALRDTRLP